MSFEEDMPEFENGKMIPFVTVLEMLKKTLEQQNMFWSVTLYKHFKSKGIQEEEILKEILEIETKEQNFQVEILETVASGNVQKISEMMDEIEEIAIHLDKNLDNLQLQSEISELLK